MVRRVALKRAILFTVEGLVVIAAVLIFLNYRTLFGSQPQPAQETKQVTKKPEQTVAAPKPLAAASLLSYTNDARKKAGLKPLALNDHLNASALAKADDMVTNNYYDHENPTTKQQGYTYIYANIPETCKFVGENLYRFDADPTDKKVDYAKQAVDNWVAEAGNDKVALFDPDYTLVGFGIKGRYVVQHFCQL